MTNEQIKEGFQVFASDRSKPFGAVRVVARAGHPSLVVYVENGGDFTIPLAAVTAVHAQKVIVDASKLDTRLQQAIAHAHDNEDPRIP